MVKVATELKQNVDLYSEDLYFAEKSDAQKEMNLMK